jgi:D-2-hydroxyacid dehydrogenase (NADP+)
MQSEVLLWARVQALISALQNGAIAGAAIDVTINEPLEEASALWEMPNVLITPHTGGETSMYEERLVDILEENTARWEKGQDFIHRIV